MHYFLFNYSDPSGESTTVIFDPNRSFSLRIEEALKHFHTYNEQCVKTVYIYPDCRVETQDELRDQVANVSRKNIEDVKVVSFQETGIPLSEEIHGLFYHGLCEIIRKRNALLESDENFHYVLPSEKHSPFFIRTGNILVKSCEIDFIALVLMSTVDLTKFSYILCDTSSILHIPYAASSLIGLFNSGGLNVPFVSFGSYQSVDGYDFRPNSLVLISASSSGDLEEKVRRKQKDIEVVTILYNNAVARRCLINIHTLLPALLTIKSNIQYRAQFECEYCQRNSIPVVVRGEQFIPSKMIIQRILLQKSHVPIWVQSAGKYLLGRKAIYVNRGETVVAKRREIFIDLSVLLNEHKGGFKKVLNKFLDDALPGSITNIVFVSDQGSQLLARYIHERFATLGRQLPEPLPAERLGDLSKKAKYNFLVISACITTGNRLNSISRDLRDFVKSSVHYLGAISRLEDLVKERTLAKNLEYKSKEKRYRTHRFHKVLSCHMGDNHDQLYMKFERPPWVNELEYWRAQVALPALIQTRLELLDAHTGILDDLFFDSPFEDGTPKLRLRKNFAFFDFKENRDVTQADVYTIISSLFHALRKPGQIPVGNTQERQKFLVQHEHVRSILDPECFKRYNDGIIQACILRSALPAELNYSSSERDSLDMLQTLKDLFKKDASLHTKEALLEFLFAIITEKLSLQKNHELEFLNLVDDLYGDIEIVSFFLSLRKQTFG